MNTCYNYLVILSVFWNGFERIEGACTFPTTWDGTWYDSSLTAADVTFNKASLQVTSGWTITAYSSTVSTWTCVDHDSSSNLILFKGDQHVNLFSSLQNAFRCLKYTKMSDGKYIYYVYADIQVNANNARVHIESHDPSVTTYTISSTYCNPSDLSTEEYAVLVQASQTSAAKVYFPTPFLGTFAYTHNDGSSTTCGSGSVWDVCTDRQIMTVNYTQCATKQFFSTGGESYCVYYTSSGSTYYTTVLNTDSTVDFSTTYRFTCYAVTSSGSTVYASDSKGQCERSQSPTTKQSDGTGTMVFTPYVTCPFTTDEPASASSLGLIIAIVVVLLLLIIAVIVGFILYKKFKGQHKTMHQTLRENQAGMALETYRDALKKVSLEELSPRDATAIDIPEKKQLEPISVPVANGVETSTCGNPPLPPIRH
nr:uncharacterized protein LOC105325274 isoform X4 [Crassostrea gigas]